MYLSKVLEVVSFTLQVYVTPDRSSVIAGLMLFFQRVLSVRNVATHFIH